MTFYQSKSINEYYRAINKDLNLSEPPNDINLYFFFDLYQNCQNIINNTDENDHIILIGDTPSYFKPILEKHRKTYNLPYSGGALGCFRVPYSLPFSYEERYSSYSIVPTKRQLHSYFDYLDNNTALTRNFIHDNWQNIVLVDTSSGPSIHGVSVFFNRYVGNILEERLDENDQLDCTNTKNSKPLRFIKVTSGSTMNTNIEPKEAQLFFENIDTINYDPKLIIFQGHTIFSHVVLFLVYEYFPRYVPGYSTFSWDQDPYKNDDPQGYYFVEKIKLIYELFLTYEKNIEDATELFEIIKSLPYLSHDITFIFNKNSITKKIPRSILEFIN